MPNTDQPQRLLDLLPDPSDPGFGAAMLRLAQMAAAQHRADAAAEAQPWAGLTTINVSTDSTPDTAEHGGAALTRSPRFCGADTTEGDR